MYTNFIILVNNNTVLIHFNCITSLKGKIYKQKELLMYNNDEDEYYSSRNNNYIKIEYENSKANIHYDRNVIMLGFYFAIKTQRIFILPKFLCKNSLMHKDLKYKNCSYDELFDIHSLDNYLKIYYRENVFKL